MLTLRVSNLLVSLALMSVSLVESIALVLHNAFSTLVCAVERPISNIVESIYATGHALKARFVKAIAVARRYAASFAANHVAMLRSKGPVSGRRKTVCAR